MIGLSGWIRLATRGKCKCTCISSLYLRLLRSGVGPDNRFYRRLSPLLSIWDDDSDGMRLIQRLLRLKSLILWLWVQHRSYDIRNYTPVVKLITEVAGRINLTLTRGAN